MLEGLHLKSDTPPSHPQRSVTLASWPIMSLSILSMAPALVSVVFFLPQDPGSRHLYPWNQPASVHRWHVLYLTLCSFFPPPPGPVIPYWGCLNQMPWGSEMEKLCAWRCSLLCPPIKKWLSMEAIEDRRRSCMSTEVTGKMWSEKCWVQN